MPRSKVRSTIICLILLQSVLHMFTESYRVHTLHLIPFTRLSHRFASIHQLNRIVFSVNSDPSIIIRVISYLTPITLKYVNFVASYCYYLFNIFTLCWVFQIPRDDIKPSNRLRHTTSRRSMILRCRVSILFIYHC